MKKYLKKIQRYTTVALDDLKMSGFIIDKEFMCDFLTQSVDG